METIIVELKRDLGSIPKYETEGSAGMDLSSMEHKIIPVGDVAVIDTGLKIAVPEGYEAQIRPRSGLAVKHSITVLNSPGTIDSDYRGPLKVILMNLGTKDFEINLGDRIAQIVFVPVVKAVFKEVNMLSDTKRGSGGFGSTGVNNA